MRLYGMKYEQCEERKGGGFYNLKLLHTIAYKRFNEYLDKYYNRQCKRNGR